MFAEVLSIDWERMDNMPLQRFYQYVGYLEQKLEDQAKAIANAKKPR